MSGFPPDTEAFLRGIADHNDKVWFEANRPLYESGYVAAGARFVETVGPELARFAPGLGFAPKVGGSIQRLNRDLRFSRDRRPYKAHLDLWFWLGEGRGWSAPGFFLRLTPSLLWLGTGMHAIQGDMLTRFREAVVDEAAGAALVGAVETVRRAGPYVIGGRTRRQPPHGYDRSHPRAEYLLYEALYAHFEAPADIAYEPGFTEAAIGHFRNAWPIAHWLLEHVAAD